MLRCLLIFLVMCPMAIQPQSVVFTNVKCRTLDPSFATFAVCRLKMIGRGMVALNLKAHLLKGPINDLSVNVAILRKFNGYRPFLYNQTVDVCNYLHKPTSNPVVKIIYQAFKDSSNINHSCPYDNDIIVDKLVLRNEMFALLPLPRGEYMLRMRTFHQGSLKAEVEAYMDFKLPNTD